ncbi:MAG TPA: dithiol-disulfide isomerase [Anaerolineae bacterium]
MIPAIEIYSSMECPYAYLATFRLRQVWPEYAGRVRLVWRALSLEYVNRQAHDKPTYDAEYGYFPQIEPALPWRPWSRPLWQWPVTLWPAYEALACAQAQGDKAALAMSWALRHAFFTKDCNLSLRHELLVVAERVATEGKLDLAQFEADWDHGRYKHTVIADSRRGWHELKVNGSATFVLPDGRQITNPGIGDVDFDEENNVLRSYTPYEGDPLDAYRQMLDAAIEAADA